MNSLISIFLKSWNRLKHKTGRDSELTQGEPAVSFWGAAMSWWCSPVKCSAKYPCHSAPAIVGCVPACQQSMPLPREAAERLDYSVRSSINLLEPPIQNERPDACWQDAGGAGGKMERPGKV